MATQALRLSRSDTLRFPAGARCVAYVRVSTERQAGEAKVSPETQLEACRRFAKENGYAVDHVIEDHESGAHLDRLHRLLAACQSHRLPSGQRGVVVYYNASRWARFEDHKDATAFRQMFSWAGWDVRSATEPDDPLGFGQMGTDLGASTYRIQLRQAVIDNMPKVAAGGWWQGRAPFGYVVVQAEGGRHKLAKGSERDMATVRDIFARFAKGKTLRAIAAELNQAKVSGPFDQHPSHTWDWSESGRRAPCGKWTSSSVRSILRCETYTGRIVFKPREVRDAKGKVHRFKRNHVPEFLPDETRVWVVAEDAHPAIVELRTFEVAQRRLIDKTKPRKWAQSVDPFVLTGLMRCASCDDVLVGGGGTRCKAKDPGATRFYRCRGVNTDTPTCTNPMLTINQRWIEREVIARVSVHVTTLVKSGKLEKLLDERLGSKDDGKGQHAVLGRELKLLEQQRRTLVEKVSKGLLADDDAAETLATIKARLAAVGREIEALKIKPTRTDQKAEKARLLKLASDFPVLIKKVPAPVARELLAYWIEGITLDKRGRIGTLMLRQIPEGFAVVNQVRQAAAKRCSRGGSPPFSRR